jgi:hypothetical protein
MRWPELILRLTSISSPLIAIAYNASMWITAPLSLIALAATAELAIRPYATNAADRLLLGCGAIVVVFIVIGLILNLTPWGLTTTTWSASWLAISLGVLIWRRGFRTGIGWPAAEIRSLGVWVILTSLILTAAVVVALAGLRAWNKKPLLALSVVSKNQHSVVVEIEANSIKGAYQIVATSTAPSSHQYSSKILYIDAGANGERVQERIPINISGAWKINLESPNNMVVRWVKVDIKPV